MSAKRPLAEALLRQIELRAYLIWESEGRPHGRHDEHWARAEAEILGAGKKKAPARKAVKAAAKTKPKAKKR